MSARISVIKVYNHLTALGLIRHNYGWIEIIDRPALRQHTCECFDLIEELHCK